MSSTFPTILASLQLALSGVIPNYINQKANDNIQYYFRPYRLYQGLTLNYSLAEPINLRSNAVLEGYFSINPYYDYNWMNTNITPIYNNSLDNFSN